jgi:hypothetical protein
MRSAREVVRLPVVRRVELRIASLRLAVHEIRDRIVAEQHQVATFGVLDGGVDASAALESRARRELRA